MLARLLSFMLGNEGGIVPKICLLLLKKPQVYCSGGLEIMAMFHFLGVACTVQRCGQVIRSLYIICTMTILN